MATRYPTSARMTKRRPGASSSAKRKKVLRPGLKRNARGMVVKDRRVARVAKRRTAFKLRRGPYRRR